jgi:heme/copper-type cytochrome/quinol oxidase subunit 3
VVSVGVWLFLAADLFFFAGWWFSFFYLRALNSDQAWMIQGLVRPNRGFGTVVLILAVLSALAYFAAARTPARGFAFRLLAPVSLVLGIAAVLYQGYGMWHLGFGLTDGAYPSVFSGLTGSWLVQLAGAVVWLATVVLQTRGDTLARPHSATSFSWILLFLAAVGVINYFLLYFVA